MNKRLKTCDNTYVSITSIDNSTPKKICYFDKVNDNILVKILTYLPIKQKMEIEKVCQQWKKISMSNIWHNITDLDLLPNSKMLKTEFSGKLPTLIELQGIIIRCGRFLKSIKLGAFYDSTVMNIIRYNCQNLLSLELDLLSYSSADFFDVFSRMEKLKILKIHSLFDDSTFNFFSGLRGCIEDIYLDARNDSGKTPTLQNVSSLCSLTINGFYIDMKTVGDIYQMKDLKNLCLRYCTLKENVQLRQIFFLKTLEKLDFLNMKSEYEESITIDDSLLSEIVYNLKNLKYLNISGCNKITVNGINLLSKLKQLEVLSMASLDLFNDKKKIRLGPFNHLKALNCLATYEINDLIIHAIIYDSPKLEQLIVDGTKITVNLLKRANRIKKKRKNNVVLSIWVGDSIIRSYRKIHISQSPYFVVRSFAENFKNSTNDN